MLKVLIVDDDPIARTNLKTLIDWERNGFEICGEAQNGTSAIQSINLVTPDIVITDMSMPIMDGVKLIGYLSEEYPDIKVIALSGYDDFDYVRQSMKHGAIDYILKHKLEPEVILAVLKSASEGILKDRQEIDKKNKLQEQLTESGTIMRQNFIRQLVYGGISEISEIKQKINELGVALDTRNISVVAIEIDDFFFLQERFSIKEINKLVYSFLDISNEILKDTGKALISHLEGGRFVIVFSFGNQMICAEMVNIVNRVAREFGIDVKNVYSDQDIPYNEMKKYETITEVKQWISNVYSKLINLLEVSKINPDFSDPTKKAMEFIQKNYAQNISLNETANHIGVSSSYLSRIFKEECKKGFIEYLNSVRVEHAKRLLEDGNCKLKDIIKEVGFNNYTYFFKVFKDLLGMTPQEYEDTNKSKAGLD